MRTRVFSPGEADAAAAVLRGGGLLAIPTETVYGLGADGTNPAAVAGIFAAKGRPADNPLILHIPEAGWMERYCNGLPPTAQRLADTFWPGPLTMILPCNDNVPGIVTAGLGTVGIRCPDHALCRAVIAAAGVPVAAPSANRSGRPSPTTVRHVLEDMDGRIDGILDGGDCAVGVESSIVDLSGGMPRLLRPGGVPLEALRAAVGDVAVDPAVLGNMPEGAAPRAPGMKYRHYAPAAPVKVVRGRAGETAEYIAEHAPPGAGVLCFAEYAGCFPGRAAVAFGAAGDTAEQARQMFDALRRFDSLAVSEIWAQCPDNEGLGLAVANRLGKAAGFEVVTVEG